MATVGRRRPFTVDNHEGRGGLPRVGVFGIATARPSASASTAMSAGTWLSSMGVDATQTPSRQWLTTTFP